jgi:lambda repressor-like predicted transcriptional regulator
MTLIEASEKSGLPYSALHARYNRGVRGEELFIKLTVQGKKRQVLYHDKIVTLKELSEMTGININTLKTRYRKGERGEDLVR